MEVNEAIRGYRVGWQHEGADRAVVADVDHKTRRLRVTVPGGASFDVDVVAARALAMLLSDAVYRALQPDGPLLAVQTDIGYGWIDLRELS